MHLLHHVSAMGFDCWSVDDWLIGREFSCAARLTDRLTTLPAVSLHTETQ